MAHVKLLENPTQFVRAAYLVDSAVGRNCPNRRDDVLLVQFFLNTLWGVAADNNQTFGGIGPKPHIDGVCGSETIGAIELFQRWYWQEPPRGGFADSRVEPPPPGQLFGPRLGNPYTIIGLNANFGIKFGIDRHSRICKEPNFPAELKLKFFAPS